MKKFPLIVFWISILVCILYPIWINTPDNAMKIIGTFLSGFACILSAELMLKNEIGNE